MAHDAFFLSAGLTSGRNRSALGGGAGAGLVDSVVAVSELVLVLGLQVVDASAAIELATKDLICLNETLKLASQVSVLTLEALSVLLECFSLSQEVTVVGAALRLSHAEALNVASEREEHVLLLLKAELRVTNLDGDISVTALLEVNFLSKVIVLASNTFVVSAESGVLSRNARVLLTDASKLPLSVLERELLVPEVSAAAVEQFLCVFDAGLSAGQLKVERLELVSLIGSLSGPLLVHLLQAGELTPHLSALNLHAFDLALEILELSALIVVLVTLGDSLLAQAASLEVLLVEQALGAGQLIVEVEILLGPIHIKKLSA